MTISKKKNYTILGKQPILLLTTTIIARRIRMFGDRYFEWARDRSIVQDRLSLVYITCTTVRDTRRNIAMCARIVKKKNKSYDINLNCDNIIVVI